MSLTLRDARVHASVACRKPMLHAVLDLDDCLLDAYKPDGSNWLQTSLPDCARPQLVISNAAAEWKHAFVRPYLRTFLHEYLLPLVQKQLVRVSVCTNSLRASHADPWLDEIERLTCCEGLLKDRWWACPLDIYP